MGSNSLKKWLRGKIKFHLKQKPLDVLSKTKQCHLGLHNRKYIYICTYCKTTLTRNLEIQFQFCVQSIQWQPLRKSVFRVAGITQSELLLQEYQEGPWGEGNMPTPYDTEGLQNTTHPQLFLCYIQNIENLNSTVFMVHSIYRSFLIYMSYF